MPGAVLSSCAGLVLLLTVTGCSGGGSDGGSNDTAPTVAREVVEQQITSVVVEKTGSEPDRVACPDDLLGKIGTVMRCTMDVGDTDSSGAEVGRTVTVTVDEVVGDEAKFNILVGDAP